ncbi:MAG: hypothetical protein EAY75_03515 [Bacteroidetes bacterium]|nr:MAG: hypothetical protein EAY75_03515 [Bacteroidota bacterium]
MKTMPAWFIWLTFGCSGTAFSQYVGIGTTTPTHNLTVVQPAGGTGILQRNGTMQISIELENPSMGSWVRSTFPIHFATNANSVPAITLANRKMGIGLGGVSPDYSLDVRGRVRLRHGLGNNTSGILVSNGTSTAPKSFIGMMDDNHVGLYRSEDALWNMVMNVQNGNVGIGTNAPTAKLDVNGDLRIRGLSASAKGSLYSSLNANGEAMWQKPVSFFAGGTIETDKEDFTTKINAATWTKLSFDEVYFSTEQSYQSISQQWVVAEKGLYQVHALVDMDGLSDVEGIRLMRSRGGITTVLLQQINSDSKVPYSGDNLNCWFSLYLDLNTEMMLEANDKLWVEVYCNFSNKILAQRYQNAYFKAYLIYRL